MRRSGVLSEAGDLRATLVWSHPDAQIALYGADPGGALAWLSEIAPEYGIEAFEAPEQERGAYRIEVRRHDPDAVTAIDAQLLVVFHEGRDDEVFRRVPLRFDEGRERCSFAIEGSELTEG